MIYVYLVGGLEHFLFFHIFGTVIPIDFHIFQRGLVNHQPVMKEDDAGMLGYPDQTHGYIELSLFCVIGLKGYESMNPTNM